MNNKKIPIILGISVILIAGIIAFAQNSGTKTRTYKPVANSSPTASTTDKTYTLADVSSHNSQSSC